MQLSPGAHGDSISLLMKSWIVAIQMKTISRCKRLIYFYNYTVYLLQLKILATCLNKLA